MDFFEQVLPLIFLAFWAAIALARRKKNRKPVPAGENRGSSARNIVADEEDKQEEPVSGNSLLKELLGGMDIPFVDYGTENDVPVKHKTAPEEVMEWAKSAAAGYTPDNSRKRAAGAGIAGPLPVSFPASSSFPAVPEHKTGARLIYDISQLRKAVVWLEIIGPPSALRD